MEIKDLGSAVVVLVNVDCVDSFRFKFRLVDCLEFLYFHFDRLRTDTLDRATATRNNNA